MEWFLPTTHLVTCCLILLVSSQGHSVSCHRPALQTFLFKNGEINQSRVSTNRCMDRRQILQARELRIQSEPSSVQLSCSGIASEWKRKLLQLRNLST